MSEQKIIQGDCLEVMKTFPDKSFDLVLTDFPYGIGFDYDIYDDTKENLEVLIKKSFEQFYRLSERFVVFSGITNLWMYPKADWVFAYTWNTTGSPSKFGFNQWQPILVYGKDLKGFGSINGILKSDLFSFSGMGSAGYSKNKHTCPKPINIMKKLVARMSNETDAILDPFMGSGTTLVAAKLLNRNATGIEISPEYCKIAEDRLRQGVLI